MKQGASSDTTAQVRCLGRPKTSILRLRDICHKATLVPIPWAIKSWSADGIVYRSQNRRFALSEAAMSNLFYNNVRLVFRPTSIQAFLADGPHHSG